MSLFAAGPDVLHFFSYATGVSIELPVGFTTDAEDDVSATYVDEDDDGGAPARVQVRVVGDLDPQDPGAAVRALADGFARAGNEVLAEQDTVVDGELPARTVLARRADDWLLHQTVLAGDGRLLTVVGMIPPERAADLPAALDAGIRSIRVIRL
jgi:hypothetical protein